jgi:hypothetical protein
LPQGGRGIDAFIGAPDMIGQGHGATFLRERAIELIAAGAPLVAIDPDPANLRARAAYAKAGFVETRIAPTPAGELRSLPFRGGSIAKRSGWGPTHLAGLMQTLPGRALLRMRVHPPLKGRKRLHLRSCFALDVAS